MLQFMKGGNTQHRYHHISRRQQSILLSKTLKKGDVFFPKGLVHFLYNVGSAPAVAISGLNSQSPGVITLANTVFGVQA